MKEGLLCVRFSVAQATTRGQRHSLGLRYRRNGMVQKGIEEAKRGLHLVPVIITSSTSKTDGMNDGMFMKCIISAV